MHQTGGLATIFLELFQKSLTPAANVQLGFLVAAIDLPPGEDRFSAWCELPSWTYQERLRFVLTRIKFRKCVFSVEWECQ